MNATSSGTISATSETESAGVAIGTGLGAMMKEIYHPKYNSEVARLRREEHEITVF